MRVDHGRTMLGDEKKDTIPVTLSTDVCLPWRKWKV